MVDLMQHQAEGVKFLSDKNFAGLFFEMGLGKTITALEDLQDRLVRGDNPFPCLIICPLSVVSVWPREVREFSYPFSCTTVLGTRHERQKALGLDSMIYIINYEGARIMEQDLIRKEFKTVILDESHRIKNRVSQQSQSIFKISAFAKTRRILSGTPFNKSPEDLWSQIYFLDRAYLPNFYSFRNKYVEFKSISIKTTRGFREIKKAVRFKNLRHLEGLISPLCLRKTKEECLDLPDKIYKTIYCSLSTEQANHYFALSRSLATMLEEKKLTVPTAASLIQKLQQICQGFVYDENGKPTYFKNPGKLVMLKDLLQDLENEKIIMFTWYNADIDLLSRELGETYKILVYDGDSNHRAEISRQFQDSDGPCIFLSNIEKAKEGITLTAASHVIYYGNTYRYESRAQSEDRAHRKGQKNNVIYYDLVIPRTVDELVHDSFRLKKHAADTVTGDSMRLAKLIIEGIAA